MTGVEEIEQFSCDSTALVPTSMFVMANTFIY